MDGTSYRHGRPVDPAAAEELRTALAFFYGNENVAVRREADATVVAVSAKLSERELAEVVQHFLRGHREIPTRVVAEREPPEAHCDLPADDRIEVAAGTYLEGPDWAAAMAGTVALIRKRLLPEFPAPALRGPAQIARDVLVRAGYYRKFPNLVNAISRIRPDYWDGVAVAQLRPGQTEALSSFYLPSDMVLNPVTCYHIYANASSLLSRYGVGRFVIDGPVFRHESHNHDATRLAEFNMTEIVRLGSAADVTSEFDRLLDAFTRFFTGLGVPYRIVTAADPFFGEDPTVTRSAQLLSGSKFEVRIPLLAGELSVASVNSHGAVFADAFGLRAEHGTEATCCAGIGLERLTFALTSYGLSPKLED
jgi:hypothetical protein